MYKYRPYEREASVVNLGTWELQGSQMRPTHQHYVERAKWSSAQASSDSLVKFNIPAAQPLAPCYEYTVHLSRIKYVGGPLAIMLEKCCFKEGETHTVVFHETRQHFEVIRDYLYGVPIDLSKLKPEIVYVADRWELQCLFQGYLRWTEYNYLQQSAKTIEEFVKFVQEFLPIIATVQVPKRFQLHFAMRFAIGFYAFEDEYLANCIFPSLNQSSTPVMPPAKRTRPSASLVTDSQSPTANAQKNQSNPNNSIETSRTLTRMASMFSAPGEYSPIDDWKQTDVWEAFNEAGVVQSVLRCLTALGTSYRWLNILDVILGVAEPYLSDSEIVSLLKGFEWLERHSRGEVATIGFLLIRWSPRARRILRSVRKMPLERPFVGGPKPSKRVIAVFQLPHPAELENRFAPTNFLTKEKAYGPYRMRVQFISLSDELVAIVEVRRGNGRLASLSDGEVRVMQGSCLCGLKLEDGLCDLDVMGGAISRQSFSDHGFRLGLQLMNPSVYRKWGNVHNESCGLVARISVAVE